MDMEYETMTYKTNKKQGSYGLRLTYYYHADAGLGRILCRHVVLYMTLCIPVAMYKYVVSGIQCFCS